jgi:hypothetical protein
MLNLLRHMDRRWVFLAMLLAVGTPVYLQTIYPERLTPPVEDAFSAIEALPPDSTVLVAMDFDPGSQAELMPMAVALVRHLSLRGQNMIFLNLWPAGGPLMNRVVNDIVRGEFGDSYVYGKDYVKLGYKAGNEMVIKVIATDLRGQYPSDQDGVSLDNMPLTQGIRNLRDINMIVSVSAGTPGTKEWVLYAANRYKIPLVAGNTGVQSTSIYPYYPNQVTGMLPAIKGAAEYEAALGAKYPQYADPEKTEGIRRMGPQLWGHLLMVGLIVLGNVIYFADRRKGVMR